MPRRSNDFQRLIFLIKQQLAPSAIATESKELPDVFSGSLREVDVVIETTVAQHPLVVSVECRDHTRKVGVGWIEEMKTKHDRLPTNKLVLVSKQGFTREARVIAAAYGIDLLSLDSVTPTDLKGVFGEIDKIWLKQSHIEPLRTFVVLKNASGAPETIDAPPGLAVFQKDGTYFGEIIHFLNFFFTPGEVLNNVLVRAQEEHNLIKLSCGNLRLKDGNSAYLQKSDGSGLREILSIDILARAEFKTVPFSLKHAVLGDARVSWGTGEVDGSRATLVGSQDPQGNKRITIEGSIQLHSTLDERDTGVVTITPYHEA